MVLLSNPFSVSFPLLLPCPLAQHAHPEALQGPLSLMMLSLLALLLLCLLVPSVFALELVQVVVMPQVRQPLAKRRQSLITLPV
jgi:hypothetical protein